MLLTLLHLLDERLGLFLVGERQPRRAVLELESMEESAVLVVREVIVDFLVPNHTLSSGLPGPEPMSATIIINLHEFLETHRDIDHFQPKGASD
jgi:hypothetical protein